MWSIADRIVKMASNLTVGTVIVLVHARLAGRESSRVTMRQLATPTKTITPRAPSATARRSLP